MATHSSIFFSFTIVSQAVAQGIINIDVPSRLATRVLLPDVYGYSLEPVWVDNYLRTPLATNLLQHIVDVTGKPPPIRVGGNTADQTYRHDTLPTGNDSVALPGPSSAKQFNITPAWYETWSEYFPEGTDILYTLNFAVNDSAWSNAVTQAETAYTALGEKLTLFELGNEIDHFINKGWRDTGWGVETYIQQFRNLTGQVTGSDWYKVASNPPKFQAGVFADPPLVPDQQDELDDFSIVNLTAVEEQQDYDIIGSYATHLYPQSTCDTARWYRMRLDLLSNHTTLWLNVCQYIPQVEAADRAGAPYVIGETNSVSCSGKSGISDTFGAALWGVDYVLMAASIGIQKIYFHLGAQSEYSSFTPVDYELKGEHLVPGIRVGWYGHYFVSKVATAVSNETLSVAALPDANSSSLSGYAVYAGEGRQSIKKLIFLDMGIWNGTQGLSNPSTLSATDGTMFSDGERPNSTNNVTTSWCPGRSVSITRLTGSGTNARSNVTVSGVTFDPQTGGKVGMEAKETLIVTSGGLVAVNITRADAVLLEVVGDNPTQCSNYVGTSAAAGTSVWNGLIATLVTVVAALVL
ncbi:glycoside hydrolase superfamily [Xylariales sp. AK1849]|nr:glycoside hydrolase superfamily [Xylariales sp. AK1849]